jgi:hypothetical protein
MASTLLPDLAKFVTALEETQQALLALLTEKRRALDTFDSKGLVRLSEEESVLAGRLQGLVARRGELLEQGRRAGFTGDTLLELTGAIGKHQGDARIRAALEMLQARLRRTQQRTAELQQESWVHWIISHRCYNHYTEMLELIAHGGHPAPTYGDRLPSATGGALLDAAA